MSLQAELVTKKTQMFSGMKIGCISSCLLVLCWTVSFSPTSPSVWAVNLPWNQPNNGRPMCMNKVWVDLVDSYMGVHSTYTDGVDQCDLARQAAGTAHFASSLSRPSLCMPIDRLAHSVRLLPMSVCFLAEETSGSWNGAKNCVLGSYDHLPIFTLKKGSS